MPQETHGPAASEHDREHRSTAQKIRDFMWFVGHLGLALAGGGDDRYGGSGDPGDLARPRTWYGTILQWVVAVLVFLVGLAVLGFLLLSAYVWLIGQ
jgi:hypothetical protein